MILRLWHGWTSPENADAYEDLLREEITADAVNGMDTPGMLGIDVIRRDLPGTGETEFVTIMTFEDWAAVKAFVGEDIETSVVPEADRALLSRFDTTSQHYELLSRNGNWGDPR